MIPISRPAISQAERDAVLEVLDSGMLAQGPKTSALEEAFSRVVGTEFAVATSSGTTALQLALETHGIGPGDEVITTPFTFIASTNAILLSGATPVFVDIEADTFNIDPDLIEGAISDRTKAILSVHLYGHPCDMDPIMALAEQHGLAVIEDAAQAIGAKYGGKAVGSYGTGVFSLYATKNVMSAEGGMITTDDASVAERCQLLRNHGMVERYHHQVTGYNFRMSDLHASIGLAQMGRLDHFTAQRRENALFYQANLKSVANPSVRPGCEHVWHQYTVRVLPGMDRDRAVERLREAGIGAAIFYPVPIHQQPYVAELQAGLKFPVTEKAAAEVLSLPVHPLLTEADRERVVEAVNQL